VLGRVYLVGSQVQLALRLQVALRMQQQIGQQGSLVAVFLGDALQLLAQPLVIGDRPRFL
jgi:hypothetical protein